MIIENNVSSCVWEVLHMRRMWSALFFHKVFSSMLGKDLILEFTKEMFTMKEFEQVNHLSYMVLSLCLCASPLTSLPPPAALPSHHVALCCRLVPLRWFFIPQLWPECAGQPDPRQSPAPHRWFHGFWNLPAAFHWTDHWVRYWQPSLFFLHQFLQFCSKLLFLMQEF